MSNTHTNHNDDSSYRFPATWKAFLQALYSTESSFNAVLWVWRLTTAGLSDVGHWTGCLPFQGSLVPIFALILMLSVASTYYPIGTLRKTILQRRWCGEEDSDETSKCAWVWFHDAVVAYLFIMVMFHYLSCCFQSPGIVLPPEAGEDYDDTKKQQVKQLARGSGGFWGCPAKLDPVAERARVQLYYDCCSSSVNNNKAATTTTSPTSTMTTSNSISYFPSPYASSCSHCTSSASNNNHTMRRPPRSHHCSTCQQCILQYDHHCVWMNNCIGYANYRSFVLTLFYLTVSCWYGVAMLFFPFYQPLREQVRQHGWRWLYTNGTGFLDLPPPVELIRLFLGLPTTTNASYDTTKIVIDVIYPLLLGVGAILTVFLGQHVKYICKARTTLEHKIWLQAQISIWQQRASNAFGMSENNKKKQSSSTTTATTTVNPFDQGSFRKNVLQVLGQPWWLIFLPVRVTPPPPSLMLAGGAEEEQVLSASSSAKQHERKKKKNR